VAPPRGAHSPPGGGPTAPRGDRESVHPWWFGHELEPLPAGAVHGGEPPRPVLSGFRRPRRDERVPRLSARGARGDHRGSRPPPPPRLPHQRHTPGPGPPPLPP